MELGPNPQNTFRPPHLTDPKGQIRLLEMMHEQDKAIIMKMRVFDMSDLHVYTAVSYT
jgi:hypothetical protein